MIHIIYTKIFKYNLIIIKIYFKHFTLVLYINNKTTYKNHLVYYILMKFIITNM